MRSWEGKGKNAAVTALERETLVTHAHIFLSFSFFFFLVARVIPSERQLLALEVNVKILEVHRQDEPMLVSPDDEISIKHE